MLDFNFCSIQSPFKNGAMKEMQQIDENPFAQFKSNTNRNGDSKVLSEGLHVTGPYLERVQRVQLHPSIIDCGCMHPSIFQLDASDHCFRVKIFFS